MSHCCFQACTWVCSRTHSADGEDDGTGSMVSVGWSLTESERLALEKARKDDRDDIVFFFFVSECNWRDAVVKRVGMQVC